jgi:plastocyanin
LCGTTELDARKAARRISGFADYWFLASTDTSSNRSKEANQSISLSRGATLVVKNNDVMPHKLVPTSGPAVQIRTASMSRMGAVARVRFTKAGVYRFKTKPGEDYSWASKMETKGEDNVLRLTVTVH